jgi:hypothetical protein
MATLKTVETFTDPIEAHIAKGRLDNEGIPAFIAHENHIWANWMLSHALGGVKVQVSEGNYEVAKAIIYKHINGNFEEDLSEEFDSFEKITCPKCGATNIRSNATLFSKIMLILTFGLFGIIYKTSNINHHCESCNFKWQS